MSYSAIAAEALSTSPKVPPYSRVIIQTTDGKVYAAGDTTGRTMTVMLPSGSNAMAAKMLAGIQGKAYQPYSAQGARVSLASELGDGVSVGGVQGAICSQQVSYGVYPTSKIEAPHDEDINHELPYTSRQERDIKRQSAVSASRFQVLSDLIAMEVERREEDGRSLRTLIEMTSDRITLEAARRDANEAELSSRIQLQADAILAEVRERQADYGELSGRLDVQAGQISAEVHERQSGYNDLSGRLEVQAGQISAKVSNTNSGQSFGWALSENDWTIRSGGATVLRVDKDGLTVSGKIKCTELTVNGQVYTPAQVTSGIGGGTAYSGSAWASNLRDASFVIGGGKGIYWALDETSTAGQYPVALKADHFVAINGIKCAGINNEGQLQQHGDINLDDTASINRGVYQLQSRQMEVLTPGNNIETISFTYWRKLY